ncbi:hypothetical protein Peur_028276 [Populus x canadensis]
MTCIKRCRFLHLLPQRSLFLSFNTLSLLCLCLFFLSSPTICRRSRRRRRRRDSLSVIYSLQRNKAFSVVFKD